MSAPLPDMLRAERLRQRIDARHGAGCCCHIWLADGNDEDDSIAFCVGYARDAGCAECSELLAIAVRMSRTQRGKLARGGYRRLAG